MCLFVPLETTTLREHGIALITRDRLTLVGRKMLLLMPLETATLRAYVIALIARERHTFFCG